ncbi:hypothetical protein ACOMHN_013580 [Nucella lapillus]
MKSKDSMIVLLLTLILLLPVRSQDDNFFRLTYNITEEQETGIFVGNTALDTGLFNTDSSQAFQDLKFELFGNGNDKAKYFSIDGQTGVVRTKERIDREAVCGNKVDCAMILDMAVYRKTSPTGDYNFYKSIQVVIRVEDKNDNAPGFPQNVVTVTMPENMPAPYRLSTSVATDPDMIGPNSAITYTFQTDVDLFELEVKKNSDTGLTDLAIKVTQMLDREAVDSFYVTIVASDNGSPRQSGSVLINIAITDRNDNAPVFTSSNYSVNVNENASVRDPILTVSAVDKDINNNGQVMYRLGPRVGQDIKDHFQITENDGKVYLIQPVDYETVTKFVFVVEALDRGEPQQSSAVYIVVNIIDVNDNAPEIILTLSPSGTDIKEHQPANKFLGHISVSDKDSGALGNVVCQIDDPNFRLEPFDGQPDIYKIVLDQPLDHEDLPVRQVTIRCRDSDKNPLMATKTITVKVIDINDNAPQFTSTTFTGVVLENQPPGTNILTTITDVSGNGNVLRIVAEDRDDGEFGRVTYSIPANVNFTIDALTGTLNTLTTFDRERKAQYIFPVVARDHGDPPLSSTATIVVDIRDQNDHPPHFDQPIFFLEIEENEAPGSTCGIIVAVDEDTGNNAKMVYSIIRDEDNSRYFSVDRNTGEVTTNEMFDREIRDSYSFFMEVQNPSVPYYKDSAQIMVTVLDANDHDPVITNPTSSNSTLTIPNNTTVGSLIIKITAKDQDDTKNTRFEFMLPGSKRGSLFQVITVTGELILAREIRAEDAKTHKLLIVVSDGVSRPRSATATLLIRIPSEGLDVGHSGSVFSEPNFIIIVVIVVVTLLVAMLVVCVICCIFRRDRKRRAGRIQQRQVKDKMYQAAKWVSTHSLPPGDSNGSSSSQDLGAAGHSSEDSATGSEKKGKKEVSFSLEDDLHEKDPGGDVDPDTSGSLGSVFASPVVGGGVPENNNLKAPVDGRFITFVSGKTTPGSPYSTYPSCYESSDGHTYSNTPPIAETEVRTVGI